MCNSNKSRELQVEIEVAVLEQNKFLFKFSVLSFLISACVTAPISSSCRSDFLSPARLCLTFRHSTLHLDSVTAGPLNLSAARPTVLHRSFRSFKCQIFPRGETPFTYPISYAMPVDTRAREIGAGCAWLYGGSR
jgi:hypothetical protein